MVDWARFCGEHGIGYDETGQSVKRGNINIQCPWCRDGHRRMGLELGSRKWACWVDEQHRGSNPDYMVAKLLGITREEALGLLGLRPPPSAVADLVAQLAALDDPPPAVESLDFPTIELPNVFFRLLPRGKKSGPFVHYLTSRGLGAGAIERYDLHGSTRNCGDGDDWKPLANRVCIPLFAGERIIGYTGRTIAGHGRRYHTEPAGATAQSVWFENLATGGHVLVIVEGQFDAMAIDWVAYQMGVSVHAVALGGLARTRGKMAALERLIRRYRRTVLLLDDSATSRALGMQRDLSRPVNIGRLPAGVPDPGDLSARQTRQLIESWLISTLGA